MERIYIKFHDPKDVINGKKQYRRFASSVFPSSSPTAARDALRELVACARKSGFTPDEVISFRRYKEVLP